jgi:fructose-specific phosphotransferase system component IIB
MDTKVKDPKVKDALDDVRAAAQQLHGAISDAAAKRSDAIKADFQAIPLKAKAVTDSIKGSLGAQNEATKKRLTEAMTYLEATQKSADESVKNKGQAFQTSVTQTLTNARAAVEKITEAVAAKRSSASTQTSK